MRTTDIGKLETVNSVRNDESVAGIDNWCASSLESFGKFCPTTTKLDIDCITSLFSPFLLLSARLGSREYKRQTGKNEFEKDLRTLSFNQL